jgi:hypothetical protein
MKKLLLSILILLSLTSVSYSFDKWTKGQIALEATYLALHVVDWSQTLKIADNSDKY